VAGVAPSLRRLAALLGGAGKRPAALRVAFVVPVPDEARNFMREVQVGLRGGGRSGTPALDEDPHITLKQGFEAQALEPMVRYLDEIAAATGSFDVVMGGIDAFTGGILFVDVRPDPRLEALRLRIVGDLSTRFGIAPYALEREGYRFHATLGYGLSDADVAEAKRALAARRVEFRFRLETIGLLYHTGASWITYKVAKVGGSRPGPAAAAGR